MAEPSILDAGIPSDQNESSPTTVLLTLFPAIVTVTVLPGSPTPVKTATPLEGTEVSSGGEMSNAIPVTEKVIGLELIFEPYVSVATKTTFSRVHVVMSVS